MITFLNLIIQYSLQLVILLLGILAFILILRRGLNWNGKEIIPGPKGTQLKVYSLNEETHKASRYVQEFTAVLEFVSALRIPQDEGLYEFLKASLESTRSKPYPAKRFIINLTSVDYMNSYAISAFARIVIDVQENNGIFLRVIFPKERLATEYVHFKTLAGDSESIDVFRGTR